MIYGFKWVAPDLRYDTPIFDIASRVILVIAFFLLAWSAIWFWRKKTPIEPHHTPKTLIVEGPYRLSRNPIYLALVLLTLAIAIGQGSAFGLIVAVGLWRVLDQRFASMEEALLITTFGEEAHRYLGQTRRWI